MKAEKIAIIGLGYVGLPLAVAFSRYRKVVGFDVDEERIQSLNSGIDQTGEVDEQNLLKAKKLYFTSDQTFLEDCSIFIVTVPTPIDQAKRPDLSPLIQASKTVGKYLKKGALVIYESTVFPGATEEICVPILEKISELNLNADFTVGYSPERINPGDKQHRLENIKKLTSGSTPDAAKDVDDLYNLIIDAGTHLCSSIKVAEAAKVIENTQRDLNIALINELAIIFSKIDIDTQEVLSAAATKWNFLRFEPGLVGGHCIGVDPYYLTYKAQSIGYNPEIILAGRRINDSMAEFSAVKLVKSMASRKIEMIGSKVLILGLTFKENCPDLRNTKTLDLIKHLDKFGIDTEVYDPVCNVEETELFNITMIEKLKPNYYDSVVISVGHDEFQEMGIEKIKSYCKEDHIVFDLKSIFDSHLTDIRL